MNIFRELRLYSTATLLLLVPFGVLGQEVYKSSGNKRVPKQEKKKGFDPGRMVYGGNVGFMFGNSTYISLQPKVGYRLFDRLAAGVGMGFQYMKVKDYFEEYDPNISAYRYFDYKATVFTPSLWVWYTPIDFIFVNAEYQHNLARETRYRYNQFGQIESYKASDQIPQMWLGAGYRQPLGTNASFNIGLYYDLLNDTGSPGAGLDVRIGFMLGI